MSFVCFYDQLENYRTSRMTYIHQVIRTTAHTLWQFFSFVCFWPGSHGTSRGSSRYTAVVSPGRASEIQFVIEFLHNKEGSRRRRDFVRIADPLKKQKQKTCHIQNKQDKTPPLWDGFFLLLFNFLQTVGGGRHPKRKS